MTIFHVGDMIVGMRIQEALQALGINEKESAVYVALLQLGRASAYSISEKSGLKKPTTYVVLDELIKKALVYKIPRERKQLYMARSPEQVFAMTEERLKLAKEKLPELLAFSRDEQKKVNVMYFEGVNGIKHMLEYKIKEMEGKELVGFYATDENFDQDTKNEFDEYFKKEWNEKMLKNKISMRIVAPDGPTMKPYRDVDKKYGRMVKIVPKELYSSDTAIDVIGDIVRIQDYKNTQGVLLENPGIAKTMREIFEMVWAGVKEPA